MLICLPWQLNTFLNPDFCAGKNILATCPWEICQNKICFYCESLEYNRWIYGGGRGAFWSPHPWGPRVNIYTFINIMPTFISQAITVTFIIGIFHFPFHHTGYYSDFTAQFIRTWVVGILQWFHHTVYPDLGCTDITVISPHSLSGPGLYGYYSDFTAQFIRTWVVRILQWFHHTVYPDLGCTDITVISPHSLSRPGL